MQKNHLIFILVSIILLMGVGQCVVDKDNDLVLKKLKQAELDLKKKDDSLRILISQVRDKQQEIDELIIIYNDSIKNIEAQRKNKSNEKKNLPRIIGNRHTLDSIADHIVF